MIRLLVCGGRRYGDTRRAFSILDAIREREGISLIIEGGASGADRLAAEWANRRGIAVREYRADWASHGRAAGPIRNRRMLVDGRPDRVLALPGGDGTANMVQIAQDAGVPVTIVAEGEEATA